MSNRFNRPVAVVLTALMLGACDSPEPPAPTRRAERVVSLSPALTQMIIDLGRADAIVGVGAYDPVAPDDATVVGDLHHVEYEQLLAVDPTDIFIQPPASGVPQRLEELASSHGWRIHEYRIQSLRDVFATLRGTDGDAGPTAGVGGALGVPLTARGLSAEIEQQLLDLTELTSQRERPHVLVLVNTDPMIAVGAGTFLDDLLVLAGGVNVLGDSAVPYPGVDREKILALSPEVVIVLDGSPEAAADDSWIPPPVLSALDVPAVNNNRVVRLAGPTVLLPTTTMADTAARLVKTLHPHLAAEVDAAMTRDEPR